MRHAKDFQENTTICFIIKFIIQGERRRLFNMAICNFIRIILLQIAKKGRMNTGEVHWI